MKPQGILFVPDMVKAIANCHADEWPVLHINWNQPAKSQTRRGIKNLPACALIRQEFGTAFPLKPTSYFYNDMPGPLLKFKARYEAGTILYVRELHWRFGKWIKVKKVNKRTGKEYVGKRFKAYTTAIAFGKPVELFADRRNLPRWHKRPGIFMPKAATRYWLKVISVRVEQVNEISKADAVKEGVEFSTDCGRYRDYLSAKPSFPFTDSVKSFESLFDSINGVGSFKAGQWVFVYEFQRISAPKNLARLF